MTVDPQSLKRFGVHLGRCLLGYIAGSLTSGLWASLFPGATGGSTKTGGMFLVLTMYKMVLAVPAAPVLIILVEFMRWRWLSVYVALSVLAALISSKVWLGPNFGELAYLVLMSGAGIAAGSAFWFIAVRKWHSPIAREVAAW